MPICLQPELDIVYPSPWPHSLLFSKKVITAVRPATPVTLLYYHEQGLSGSWWGDAKRTFCCRARHISATVSINPQLKIIPGETRCLPRLFAANLQAQLPWGIIYLFIHFSWKGNNIWFGHFSIWRLNSSGGRMMISQSCWRCIDVIFTGFAIDIWQ